MSSSAVKKGLAGALALGLAFAPMAAVNAHTQPSHAISQPVKAPKLQDMLGMRWLKSHFDNPNRVIRKPVPGAETAAAAIPTAPGQASVITGFKM